MRYYRKRRQDAPPGLGCQTPSPGGAMDTEAILAALPDDARTAAEEDIALLPFMRHWYAYSASPAAERLTDIQLASRRRAWRSFSVWMQKTHPETTGLESVTRRTGEEYMDSLKGTFSSATCNIYLCCIREVFGHLARESGLRFNPWDVVGRLPHDAKPRRELSADEIGRIIAAAERHGSEWALLFRIAAYTGMRLGECCHLEWRNIVMEKDLIQHVPAKTRGKTGDRPVTVPLHMKLKRHLLRIPASLHWGPLMPGLSAEYENARNSLQKTITRIFAEAGIETRKTVEGRKRKVSCASFHSLRHSFVSFTANAGVPLEVVRAIVGHENTLMTRHYYHAEEALLRKAVSSVPAYDAAGNCTSQPEKTDSRPATVRLVELADALRSGLVTQAEYDTMRREILASI